MPHRNNFIRKIELKFRKDNERELLTNWCFGKGADIGCGSKKITQECIGIDIIENGAKGEFGSEKGKISTAQYCANGNKLDMFEDNELDFIVANHNLEHYPDVYLTLKEWKRVLKHQGHIAVIVPDDKYVNSMKLDPTHERTFTLETLRELFQNMGFEVLDSGVAIKHWSIYLVAYKPEKSELNKRMDG